MTSGSFEKFEEKLEREDYIQSIIREYYARKNAEVEKNMKLEVNKWKNIEKKQKEINFKATGFHETNRERKEREEKKKEFFVFFARQEQTKMDFVIVKFLGVFYNCEVLNKEIII